MEETLIRERAARHHSLAKIENLIKQTSSQYVKSPNLKAAGICHLPLSLEGDTQHHPLFFKPYQEELPLPQQAREDKLLKFEPDPDHILWDTREMNLFLTRHFHECWEYASQEHLGNDYPNSIR
ncbi:hypothetical protein BO71DRAFT_396100 [Aspergillus ellipticus CBS 707.79]|uniref:Uncharacterized protein n=1 Tax=Aspergillus ellipticus CBS 707.79 TaxID=1448320 RepID=A0A319DJ31_9EURO|nr:hypothetical protein BO71DRAFT_396100 [Aspergillus ellipticus CBS 707.79]